MGKDPLTTAGEERRMETIEKKKGGVKKLQDTEENKGEVKGEG